MPLRPDQIGQRIVVRRLLPGQTGPTGGPALTDVLGILETWDGLGLSIRRKDGDLLRIAHADIVAAKPVPPRPSVRQRIPAADLQRICSRGWQAPDQLELGAWLLRAAGGFTGRANSVLVAGEPGRPIDAALERVNRWYADRDLPVLAQVITGSDWLSDLEERGWLLARPAEADTLVLVASVSRALRAHAGAHQTRTSSLRHPPPVTLSPRLTDVPDSAWISCYGRAAGFDPQVVLGVLTSGEGVAFASLIDPADARTPLAIGRGVVTGDWLGLAAVEVSAQSRRRGLGEAIVDRLLEWGASHGALSSYVQTMSDNPAALGLFERFGFRTHHAYRYLRPPDRDNL